MSFPGAVPRSFVGPVLVASIVRPVLVLFRALVPRLEASRANLIVQSIGKQPNISTTSGCSSLTSWVLAAVRTAVLVPNLVSLGFLGHRVRRAFSNEVAALALLFSATQFHLSFYMSRTLPNMVAFPFGEPPAPLSCTLVPSGRAKVDRTRAELIIPSALVLAPRVLSRAPLRSASRPGDAHLPDRSAARVGQDQGHLL